MTSGGPSGIVGAFIDSFCMQHLSSGKDVPNDLYVQIEIPQGSNIKYEIDHETGALLVDRFVNTSMMYPMNYGYLPQSLGLDGDPVDVLVPTPLPLHPGSVIRCRPVGVILMEDESGQDEKIIAVPHAKVHPMYKDAEALSDLPELLIKQTVHFFERYKDLEEGKWVKVTGTGDAEAAKQLILEGIKRAET